MNRYTIREIAKTLDVPPADALDLCRLAGVTEFTHEGVTFDWDALKDYLGRSHRYSPVPELEFDASPAQLAAILEPEISQCISDLKVEAINNDSISSYSPNLRRLLACGNLLQGVQVCGMKPESPRSS